MARHAGFEPATSGFVCRCPTPGPMPQSRKPLRTGIGIRDGKAARTGRDCKPVPLLPGVMVSALPSLARRQFVGAAPPVGATRDAWNSFRERQKQNAPGTASEGIRSASEDRGDRPPAERSQSMVLQPSSTHSRPYAAASRLVCAVVPMLAMWIGLNTVFPPRYPSRASRRVRTLRLVFRKRKGS